MLNSKEAQISISAGLLHSLSEITGYLTKLTSNMEEGPVKANFQVTLSTLNQLEKLEIITLKNWCKEDGT